LTKKGKETFVAKRQVGAQAKPPELRAREKAVLMLTESEFGRLKELSATTGTPVSAILRDCLYKSHPHIFERPKE
jgi:hypothetical protein